jgi:hypothetical protein
MRVWWWIGPALLLAGCTGGHPGRPVADTGTAEILIPAGTPLHVRVDEPLNTRRNRAGDSFFATLESPVEVDGATLIPAGTSFRGRVTAAEPSGGMEGRAVLAVELESFSVDGTTFHVRTNVIERAGVSQGSRHIGFVTGRSPSPGGDATASAATQELVGMPADAMVTFALRAPLRM